SVPAAGSPAPLWPQPGQGFGQQAASQGFVPPPRFESPASDRTMMRSADIGPQPRDLKHEHLQFTAFHPRVIPAGTSSSLLVYAYVESALEAIQADAVKFRDELGPVPAEVDAWASQPLTRGTQITIVPEFQEV